MTNARYILPSWAAPADHLIESRLIEADPDLAAGLLPLLDILHDASQPLGWSLRMGSLFVPAENWMSCVDTMIHIMGKTFVLFAKLWQNKKILRQNKADCV